MTDMDVTMDGGMIPVDEASRGESISEAEPADEGIYAREAEGVRAVYPDFDLTAAMEHPVLGKLLKGEASPTLKQLYEATHLDEIFEGRVSEAVAERLDAAVTAAVETAVEAALAAHEQKLLAHIRARGQRPAETGARAAAGIRIHPAVGRLTRRERAMLAERARDGETIEF